MEKISAAQVAEVSRGAAQLLRKQASRLDVLEAENARLKKEARVRRIVDAMQDKGALHELEPGEKVADLLELPDHELSAVEKAVDMVGPDGVKLASVSDTPHNPAGGHPGARFQNYLLTGDTE